MYSAGLEILGIALSVIGWLGSMVACILPMWKVAAFIGQNIVVAQVIWEGLWMNCVVQSTGQMQCKVYDSLLGLPEDLQAARAMTIVSILLAIVGIMVFVAGAKCTNCMEDEARKPKITISSGVIFIISGMLQLIPVSWSANVITMDFYEPLLGDSQKREMASVGIEILGVVLAVVGWIGSIVACTLPMWRVTAFIGVSIVTSQIMWEGIWMTCVVQSTGQMQCKIYDSLLALPQDLQAARALEVISIILGLLAILISIMGAKCTNCIEDQGAKAKVMIVSGVMFILASLMQLIPVSWSANTIIRDFYNPLVPESSKREMGSSLFIGWAAASLLLFGGAILCCSCPPKETKYVPSRMAYSTAKSAAPSGYDRKDYV
ncbi:claudin-3-like isoform X2 [Acipenser ruthenus]|uniref:claudin-3-like isoform X2 n=1 Tax=Acipenser ruthenus TaxID=7906 RepID=UPI002741AB6B|nr:claudin-3-like isoform X2 [Acipenser ruthenus]